LRLLYLLRHLTFFAAKNHAINYAEGRAWFRSGQIRILDSAKTRCDIALSQFHVLRF
jgi:hypothetical protein